MFISKVYEGTFIISNLNVRLNKEAKEKRVVLYTTTGPVISYVYFTNVLYGIKLA